MRKLGLFENSVSVGASAVLGLVALALCSVDLAACKKKPPVPVTQPEPASDLGADAPERAASSLPAAPSPGPVPARCHELAHGSPFRIGELAATRAPAEDADDGGPDEDDEVPAPFSVELGPARADADGFAISALRSVKGQTHALLALLNGDAGAGKLVDLGTVHGDPDPPQFAVRGKDLLIAAPDADAGGGMLKVGIVRDARGAAQITWGPEVTGVRRDSTFALESSGDHALLAYATETAGKIRVFGALLDPSNLKQKLNPEPLSTLGADVDSPRLALRKGGYWLAMARALDAPKVKLKARALDAGADEQIEGDSVLDIGTRRIEVLKLDALGKVASSALVVTKPGARPMSFELASAADGGAYIAFRDDDSTPGTNGGALELLHVKADGSFEKVELNAQADGTGTPTLFADSNDAGKVWLTAAGENGATWFGRLSEHTALGADSVVRGSDLIAAREGKLLLTRSKGTAVELSLVQCAE
ncbi:MAG: hypothetical protein ABJB12_05210 [Pseudomonadota bacterium]